MTVIENALETMREYVESRDALLDCTQERHKPDCQGCSEWEACPVRKAWRAAWNGMNAALRPGECEGRTERFRKAGAE